MNADIATANRERRWTRGAWLTLSLALVYLLVCVFYALAVFQQPSDGWNMTNDITTGWTTVLNQGGANVLQLGDRVLAIEGVDVDTSFLPRREPPPNWRVGETARYTIVRDGRTFDLQVPLVQIPPSALPRFMVSGVDGTQFAALLTLLSGFVIFLLRPGSVAARLLLLILTYFVGTASILLASVTPTLTFFPPLLYWIYWGTDIWPMMFAMITHLALVFPVTTWPLTRWPRRLPGLLYGLTAAACVYNAIRLSEAVFGTALLTNVVFLLCAVVGATIHNLRSAPDPVIRAQIGWVAFGLGGSFALAGVSLIIGLIWPGAGDWGGYLTFLILPICLGIAITRYRLFDIDIIIRRTLVYSLLTLLLGTTYFLGVVVLQALFVRLTGQESALAVVASTLAIAALFVPLRRWVQAIIDRRFFRKKYDAQRVLEQFASRAQQQADIDDLANDIVSVVNETIQPEGIRLWLVQTRQSSTARPAKSV